MLALFLPHPTQELGNTSIFEVPTAAPTPKSHYALALASNVGPDRINGNILSGL